MAAAFTTAILHTTMRKVELSEPAELEVSDEQP